MKKLTLLSFLSLIIYLNGCTSNKINTLKIWPSIDNINIILRQTDENDFLIIDKLNNKLITASILKDTLIQDKIIEIEDIVVDATKQNNIIACNSESTIYIYDLEQEKYINKINIIFDTFYTPYSYHKYFNLKLVDSLLFIENYCIECNTRPLSALKYPVERAYNIYTGKYKDIYINIPYVAQKYYIKSDNFISRVYTDKISYYMYFNAPAIIQYAQTSNHSKIVEIKEKVERDIFVLDTADAASDYFTFMSNSAISNTSNYALFFNQENNHLYNFKFLGTTLHSDQKRTFMLQKIDLKGHVVDEYQLTSDDYFNLIFYNDATYIEKVISSNGKTTRKYEKINL